MTIHLTASGQQCKEDFAEVSEGADAHRRRQKNLVQHAVSTRTVREEKLNGYRSIRLISLLTTFLLFDCKF